MTAAQLAATGSDFPWWVVPILLVGLLVGGWLLLSGRKQTAVVFDVAPLLAPGGAAPDGTGDRIPLRPEAARLLHRVHADGHRVVVLAYGPASLARVLRAQSWAKADVDAVVVSETEDRVGLDDALCDRIERAAKARDEFVAFVGDVPSDVTCAERRDWHAYRSLSDEDTIAWLRKIDLLSGDRHD